MVAAIHAQRRDVSLWCVLQHDAWNYRLILTHDDQSQSGAAVVSPRRPLITQVHSLSIPAALRLS